MHKKQTRPRLGKTCMSPIVACRDRPPGGWLPLAPFCVRPALSISGRYVTGSILARIRPWKGRSALQKRGRTACPQPPGDARSHLETRAGTPRHLMSHHRAIIAPAHQGLGRPASVSHWNPLRIRSEAERSGVKASVGRRREASGTVSNIVTAVIANRKTRIDGVEVVVRVTGNQSEEERA